MKLIDILREIGSTSDKKVDLSLPAKYMGSMDVSTLHAGRQEFLKYKFSTDSNTYNVKIQKKPYEGSRKDFILNVSFGVESKEDPDSTDFDVETNDLKNLFKVINTVVKIVQEVKDKIEYEDPEEKTKKTGEAVKRLEFEPTKRKVTNRSGKEVDDKKDERRANLYIAYLKKQLPGKEVYSTKNKSAVWVDL